MTRSAEGRRPPEWRTLFLSTGEIGLAEKIGEDGRGGRATAGQEVRVLDLSANAGAGLGLFEDLHGDKTSAEFADRLKDATNRFYGTAGPAFVEAIAGRRAEVAQLVKGYRDAFVQEQVLPGSVGQVMRAAQRFGLVAAAGELAIVLQVLPLERGSILKAVSRCFSDWLTARGGVEAPEIRAAIRQIRLFIEEQGESRFGDLNEPSVEIVSGPRPVNNRVGFRKADGNGGYEYIILPEAWRVQVCRGHDIREINKVLVERRILRSDTDGKASIPMKPPGFSKTVRCYVVTGKLFEEGGVAEL